MARSIKQLANRSDATELLYWNHPTQTLPFVKTWHDLERWRKIIHLILIRVVWIQIVMSLMAIWFEVMKCPNNIYNCRLYKFQMNVKSEMIINILYNLSRFNDFLLIVNHLLINLPSKLWYQLLAYREDLIRNLERILFIFLYFAYVSFR